MSGKHKVVLLGSRPLAFKVLDLLLATRGIDVIGVVPSRPPANKWWNCSLEDHAKQRHVPIIGLSDIQSISPDLALSVNYASLVRPDVLVLKPILDG